MHISYKPLWHTLLERDMRKEQVHRALISLVVLSGFTGIDKVQKCDEVLFFLRGLVPDVADAYGLDGGITSQGAVRTSSPPALMRLRACARWRSPPL